MPTEPVNGHLLLFDRRRKPSARPRKPMLTSPSLRGSLFPRSLRLLPPPRRSSIWRPPALRGRNRILLLFRPCHGPPIRSTAPSPRPPLRSRQFPFFLLLHRLQALPLLR